MRIGAPITRGNARGLHSSRADAYPYLWPTVQASSLRASRGQQRAPSSPAAVASPLACRDAHAMHAVESMSRFLISRSLVEIYIYIYIYIFSLSLSHTTRTHAKSHATDNIYMQWLLISTLAHLSFRQCGQSGT